MNGDVMSDVDQSNINDDSLTSDPTGSEVCQISKPPALSRTHSSGNEITLYIVHLCGLAEGYDFMLQL